MSATDDPTLTPNETPSVAPSAAVPTLTIMAHPDLSRVGERARLADLAFGGWAELSRLAPTFGPPHRPPAEPLADPFLSRRPIRLAGEASGAVVVDAAGVGHVVVEGEPLAGACHLDPERLESGVVLELSGRVVLLLQTLEPDGPEHPESPLVGENPAVQRLRTLIGQIAPRPTPVLLRGETGTGKELVAEAIHKGSGRRGPFISVNMSAIPPGTAASALFGHTQGAFTGAASAHAGYFVRAHTGTLFLDEVGDTPREIQSALLRATELGELQPVGASTPQRVDVRLIAATDSDLESAVADGRFRRPLLHRLGVAELWLPPLRARRDDIGRLLVTFLRHALAELGCAHRLSPPSGRDAPWLPASLVAQLCRHGWPGNVRELRNVAQRLAIASADQPHAALERPLTPAAPELPAPAAPSPIAPKAARRLLEDYTEEEVVTALERSGWRPGRAARELGVSRTTLYALIDRMESIRKAADLPASEVEAAIAEAGGDLDRAALSLHVSPRGLKVRARRLGLP